MGNKACILFEFLFRIYSTPTIRWRGSCDQEKKSFVDLRILDSVCAAVNENFVTHKEISLESILDTDRSMEGAPASRGGFRGGRGGPGGPMRGRGGFGDRGGRYINVHSQLYLCIGDACNL